MQTTVQKNAKTVSVDYLTVLLLYAEQKGVAAQEILAGTQLDTSRLASSDSYITTGQYQLLIDNAIAVLNEPALALKLGQRQHLATHGALGYAIMSSSSLEQALQMVRRFIRTRNRLIHFKFFLDKEQAVTQIEVKHPMDGLYQHFVELAFSSMMLICNSLADKQHQQCHLSLRYPKPQHSDVYFELFHTSPTFNAELNEIRLPMAWFKGVNLMGNPLFAEIAQQQCENLLVAVDKQDSLQDQINTLLSHSPGHIPSQSEVASQLKLSTRSMSRQLAQQNTSFQKIVNNLRQQLAMNYLANSDRSIEEVACLLDYESPPNFTRAFRRWTGLTPLQYRQQQGRRQNG